MGSMDGWDLAIMVLVGYVAVVSLVRLMLLRRDDMMKEFREELAKEKNRRTIEDRQQAA